MKRFEKDSYLIVRDGSLARQIVKKPIIKQMRKNDELIVGHDRAKGITLIWKKPRF